MLVTTEAFPNPSTPEPLFHADASKVREFQVLGSTPLSYFHDHSEPFGTTTVMGDVALTVCETEVELPWLSVTVNVTG